MTSAVATRPAPAAVAQVGRDATPIEVLERVIVSGDLAALAPQERVALYARTCESLGLNPLTRPFEYITLNSKLTLYVRKDATDQLRRLYRVSIDSLRTDRDVELGLLTVTADGHTPDGRRDQSTGAVFVKGLGGEALANACMKAETKAKRRLTLSLVGLGFLDESEIEGAERVDVDPETGEVRRSAPAAKPSLLDAVNAQAERLTGEAQPRAPAPAPVARVVSAEPQPDADEPPLPPEPPVRASAARPAAAVAPEATPPAAPAAPAVAAGPMTACDAPSPYEGDSERCGLAKGHTRNHRARSGATW